MQYLDALGIETFVPRVLLANAKSSRQCVFEEPAAVAELSVDKHHSENFSDPTESSLHPQTVATLSQGLSAVLSDLEQGKTTAKASQHSPGEILAEPEGETSSKEAAPAEPFPQKTQPGEFGFSKLPDVEERDARFNLALWLIDSQVQVIDSQQAEDALPTEILLNNILIATGLLNTSLPKAEFQRWPLNIKQSKDKSWSAAAAMLYDFLSYRFDAKPVKGLIVFGEDAASAIFQGQLVFDHHIYQAMHSDKYQKPVLILPALRDLLYNSSQKRNLWSAIQRFRLSI